MEVRKPLSPSPRIQRAVRGVGRYHVKIDRALAAGFALALSTAACSDAQHPPGASEDAGDPIHGDDAAMDNDSDPPTGTGLKQVALSSGFVCTLRVDGAVACQMLRTGEPVAPFGWTNFKMIALGRGTGGSGEIVGLRSSGEVESYRFLVGTEASVAVADVESIGGGDSHFCARHSDGTVSCWGRSVGQFGTGLEPVTVPPDQPVKLPIESVRAMAVGGHATCVIREDRKVACAGWLSPHPDGLFAVVPSLGDHAEKLYMGGVEPDAAACVLDGGGALRCTYSEVSPPSGESSDVAVGHQAVCALFAGALKCSGTSWDYHTAQLVSVQPSALPSVVSVATDSSNWCAITVNDEVWCWGGVENWTSAAYRAIGKAS